MPGDWTMSPGWLPGLLCGGTWLRAAASFLGMWMLMMVAMMLPALVPMLRSYRRSVGGRGERSLGWLTALVALGYFSVWSVPGIAVWLSGVALAALATRLPMLACAVPFAVGVVVLLAGALQLSAWKARLLVCCRRTPCHDLPPEAGTACASACSAFVAVPD